ncbi:hypothetical protein MNEG_10296 [Monoraphidium neglectum]|uniref:EamA domain-containing protein n=1 Tax=Monoraphidium neglectum TaxID=145388 RepID=A0A0D2M9M3_9CHLO|nr:hypothetical protein MNEG_10296 [Monoraphidium neglectum]KIY97666.1 hypothetical protein MNEG_10296 [Monoraphidium neglectum]|eukprot:XP_013896686.1 hypothetical protein MNEG_10296 [Monoraphidium neglectum]
MQACHLLQRRDSSGRVHDGGTTGAELPDGSTGEVSGNGGGGDGGDGGDAAAPLLGGAQPGGPLLLSRGALVKAALMVGPTWFLAQLCFAWSLALTSVTSNTILSSTSCLFAFLASVLFLGERFTARKALSVVAVMAGTAAVALADTSSGGDAVAPLRLAAALGPLAGDLLATGAAALYAAYTIQIQGALGSAGAGDTALFFGHLGALTAALLLPVLGVMQWAGALDLGRVAPASLGLACFNGLMDYVLADFLWARAVLLLGPTIATLGLSIQIPMATALDVFLGRPAWLRSGAAAALTFGGSALVLGGFVAITLAGAAGPAAGAAARSEGGGRGTGERAAVDEEAGSSRNNGGGGAPQQRSWVEDDEPR